MKRFVIADHARCIGCNTCMAACSMVHKAVGLQAQPRLTVTRHEGRTAPVLCRHCEGAPCARVCPVGAISETRDAVQLNETLCIGCKLCAIACPFGAITPGGTPATGVAAASCSYVAPPSLAAAGDASDSDMTLHPILVSKTGVRTIAIKCDLCEFSERGPECVKVCPTRAMFVVDGESIGEEGSTRQRRAARALSHPMGIIPPGEQK